VELKRPVVISVIGACAATLAVAVPASADQGRFRDAANDVVNARTGKVTTIAAGIDVRAIRVRFSDQALNVKIHHKNLTRVNAPDRAEDGLLLDTNRKDRGPEWIMVLRKFDYQLYKIDTFYDANHLQPRMRRACGDGVFIDHLFDNTNLYLPDRCFHGAGGVRVYGAFRSKEADRARRDDYFLGYRKWTPWVRRGQVFQPSAR
jgi:hypothetical protein